MNKYKITKWTAVAAAFVFTIFGTLHAQHAYIEQNLLDVMAEKSESETMPVVLMLSDAVDVAALKNDLINSGVPVDRRPQAVIGALKAKAAATQSELIEAIESSQLPHGDVQQFWITNSIGLSANKALIAMLASMESVAYISLDVPMIGEVEHFRGSAPKSDARSDGEGNREAGLEVIGAHEMWAMGYTGLGVMAMTFDTGVWPDHPALTNRFLPNRMPLNKTWFPFDSEVPTDKASSHGTHVSGTMLGLDTATADTIGVGFKAYFIATDPTVGTGQTPKPLTDVMNGFEWALNPDGDDNTSDDVPDVINNSWGRSPSDVNPACAPFVISTFEAVEAAGIASIFSAGNAGPGDSTIGVPNNTNMGLVNSFSVGALDGNAEGPDYPIANFSSRGPSLCDADGSLLIKPEVSAPGVNVRSSVGNDGYAEFSGTSMASPHVSGAAILLKEAFPFLSGEEILLALYYSATDLGEEGEDNTFGMGLINVKAAFDYLSETYDPVPPAVNNRDLEILAIEAPDAPWRCSSAAAAEVDPVITVRNSGNETINGITVEYRINGGDLMTFEDATFSAAPGTDTQITLPAIASAGAGNNELHAYIVPLENEYDTFNNNAVKRWIQLPEPQANLNFISEDFEIGLDPELWTVYDDDLSVTWDTTAVIQADGNTGRVALLPFFGYSPAAGQEDLLIGPALNSGSGSYTLTFDYFYRRRTNNPNNFDTLQVGIGYNCGEAQLELWRKGGEELYTNDVHAPNAFPESAQDWATVSINFSLNDLEGADPDQGFFPVFTGKNHSGNNLMIDNINLDFAASVRNEVMNAEINLFPNPAAGEVRIDWRGGQKTAQVAVFDLRGKLVFRKGPVQANTTLDVSGISDGLYLVEVTFDSGERGVKKLVKQ